LVVPFLSINLNSGESKVQTVENTLDTGVALGPESFRQAKLEHYLQRAEDFLQMARYRPALRALTSVYRLDQNNSSARSLQKRIEYYIEASKNRTVDGHVFGTNGDRLRRRRKELILLVDQDERVLTSLTSTLRKHGFGATGASSYDEAVEAIAEFAPDMIVSEVNFENGSVGYDLFLWVRTNARTGAMPFLFLATRIDRDTLIAGKRLGVSDFVLKPLDDELVVASILNCLARTRRNGTQ
jgi:PleD family two-component response regulator